jgi:hypothetical protein
VVKSSLAGCRKLTLSFERSIGWALHTYVKAYNYPHGDWLPERIRSRVFMKVLGLQKLRAVTVGPADTGYLTKILAEFRDYQSGLNPNFAAFASVELDECASFSTLQKTTPDWVLAGWKKFQRM